MIASDQEMRHQISHRFDKQNNKKMEFIMTLTVKQSVLSDHVLMGNPLQNDAVDQHAFNRISHESLENSNDLPSNLRIACVGIHSLYLKEKRPLAVISGAGIAGLAASFELRARGFNVVVVEKRKCFSRFNVINLNVETQVFLKKFHLLEKFEKFVAARIKEHRYVLIEKSGDAIRLDLSDVSQLQLDESLSFEPQNFNKLFDQDGIYSVSIKDLQTFLAENALENGVNIFGDATVKILSRTADERVSKVQIAAGLIVQSDLFFIAEGAHSKIALELGMGVKEIKNACSGENWVFGNMSYSGSESFVVSLVDTSKKTLAIANVIFNAKIQVVNIAVTSDARASEERIRQQIEETASQVFNQQVFPIEPRNCRLLTTVDKPVHIVNRTCAFFSKGNVFCIGDSAGSSSPLAGLGGTLGLTLVPEAVTRLLDDYEKRSPEINEHFNRFSEAYTSRWIEKSGRIKERCMDIFEDQHNLRREENGNESS